MPEHRRTKPRVQIVLSETARAAVNAMAVAQEKPVSAVIDALIRAEVEREERRARRAG